MIFPPVLNQPIIFLYVIDAKEKYDGFTVESRRLRIDWDVGIGKKSDSRSASDLPPSDTGYPSRKASPPPRGSSPPRSTLPSRDGKAFSPGPSREGKVLSPGPPMDAPPATNGDTGWGDAPPTEEGSNW